MYESIKNNEDIKSLTGSFIEILNHDLKTPIIAQIRALELMIKGEFGTLNDKQYEMAELTLDSCKYMYSMVATLISTFRLDSHEFKLNYSYFNIMELLENNLNKMSKYSKERNIKIVVIPEIDTPLIYADKIRLSKVIFTLLSNGLYTAFKNSIIKIYLYSCDNEFSLKVENRSGYISPEKMKNLFDLHTDASQKFDRVGEGIGFYLVKKIIEKHNGKIIAESYCTQKNIFGFKIPIAEDVCLKNCV